MMARLAYVDLSAANHELRDLAERVAAERGGRLINQYRMLLHSPPIASAWLQFASAVRFQTTLDPASSELAICCVTRLAGAEYPSRAHSRLALRHGVSQDQLGAISDWRASSLFTRQQRAILSYAEALTLGAPVDADVFPELLEFFDERALVELTVVIAFYLMVARFLGGLEIEPETEP
ncbi:MAG: carboxymuconolactone decarboxylase family protein [Chloroflexi bacterium]|nr:carboxymuconolactone decarboxylase family protein [Chloroflexota bacterium]